MINHLHLQGAHCFVRARYPLTREDFLLRVKPGPCQSGRVTCRLPETSSIDLTNFTIMDLIIDDGKTIVNMPTEVIGVERHLFTARISDKGFVFGDRQVRRFQCSMVDAHLIQGKLEADGVLEDFTPSGLRIALSPGCVATSSTFDPSRTTQISLYRYGKAVFSSDCRVVRTQDRNRSIIVSPVDFQQSHFKGKRLRNPRVNLVPTPKAVFTHPFTSKRVTYEIMDITTSGFSVHEAADSTVLMPGMIITDMTILCAGGLKLYCSAQVIHRLARKRNILRFGFAIIDMDIINYNRLFDIYSSARDIHANMSGEMDMDSLWQFFFDSGFIYPEKYTSLSRYKDDFKQTYQKLYRSSPGIFTNFTYQNNGMIYGHLSMVKAYQRTWMIHHLAGRPMGRKRTGLHVLNHVMNYFDGLYRLPAVGMDYMIFYFRPDNRFPDYFFGGFCREYKKPERCSIDCFAYLNVPVPDTRQELSEGWGLHPCTSEDIAELRAWYENASGGLMIDAMGLDRDFPGEEPIQDLFARYGLKRCCAVFVLKHNGKSAAFFIADHSDMGVNLSELINSVKIILTDAESLTWDDILQALVPVARGYGSDKIPVMVYPFAYLDRNNIPYEKKYNLWALDSLYADDYTEHLKQKAKIRISTFLIKYVVSKVLKKQ